ncbi:pecam1 [Pungitius sinensis]
MDSGPPNAPLLLLLLTCLLHCWQGGRGQSSYTIDSVDLTILPSGAVQSGTPVTVRCHVRVSRDDAAPLRHAFQLKKDDVPVHAATTEEDSVAYQLHGARAADSGSYECRVTVLGKSKASAGRRLDVAGLQTPVLYLNKTAPYEGEEFTATCSAPEEKGSLVFRFYQMSTTGGSQKIKQPAPTGVSSETTLVLRAVGDSVLYCDYEVNLDFGRSNRSNQIPVMVKELYIFPIMNVLPSSDVFEGDVMEVVCKVVNPLRNIEVFLTKDRRILKKAPVSLSHRFTARQGDSGKLVCKAEWGNVQKETNMTVTVKELFSKPQLTMQPTDLFEGDRFQLTCSVSIYAPERIRNEIIRFAIHRDGANLTAAPAYAAVAKPSQNGNYTCAAEATALSDAVVAKGSQALVVRAKVPVSQPALSVVGGTLVLGKPFQLLCRSDSGTPPIAYTLNSPGAPAETVVASEPGRGAVFNCSAIRETPALSDFLCHARNSDNRPPASATGQQRQRSLRVIEPVSRPVLTVFPGAGDVSEGQDVTLSCAVQRGTPAFTFTWFHAEAEGPLSRRVSQSRQESYTISSVRAEQGGVYYCEADNPASETKESLRVVIAVKMAGWKKGLISGIVVCVLLILALILILALKRRLLQFKRRRTGELSVKSAGTKAERLSLTQAEVNEAANVTPGMIGKSVWSEHPSGSESEDQNSVTSPEKPAQPQQAEARQADPNRAPGETASSEARNSTQGVPEQADAASAVCFVASQQGSVEYAQLNHHPDPHGDHGNHGDRTVQDDFIDEIDMGSVHINGE